MSDNILENSGPKEKCKLQAHCFPEIEAPNILEEKSNQFQQNHINSNDEDQSQPWPKVESQDSEVEFEKLIAQAQEKGYAIGFKDGQAEEKRKIDALAVTVTEVISNLELFKAQLLEQAKESIVKLVLAISRKIIFKEPTINKEVILLIARNALKMVVDPTNLKIKANPDDLNILNENMASLENITGKSATMRIEADANILSGGCIIESDFGDIDARIDAQLQIIEKTIVEELNLEKQNKTG